LPSARLRKLPIVLLARQSGLLLALLLVLPRKLLKLLLLTPLLHRANLSLYDPKDLSSN
jgi:hypothetical protein